MLVRSQDNEKITDRIEFSIVEVPVKGHWGIYQPEPLRLFGEYSTFEKAVNALDRLERAYTNFGRVTNKKIGFVAEFDLPKVFQFPKEEEIEDEE